MAKQVSELARKKNAALLVTSSARTFTRALRAFRTESDRFPMSYIDGIPAADR